MIDEALISYGFTASAVAADTYTTFIFKDTNGNTLTNVNYISVDPILDAASTKFFFVEVSSTDHTPTLSVSGPAITSPGTSASSMLGAVASLNTIAEILLPQAYTASAIAIRHLDTVAVDFAVTYGNFIPQNKLRKRVF